MLRKCTKINSENTKSECLSPAVIIENEHTNQIEINYLAFIKHFRLVSRLDTNRSETKRNGTQTHQRQMNMIYRRPCFDFRSSTRVRISHSFNSSTQVRMPILGSPRFSFLLGYFIHFIRQFFRLGIFSISQKKNEEQKLE